MQTNEKGTLEQMLYISEKFNKISDFGRGVLIGYATALGDQKAMASHDNAAGDEKR